MLRIFAVTFIKEFTLSIVAKSQEELETALERHNYDIDDWSDMAHDEWDQHIEDTIEIAKETYNESRLPTKLDPDMGVHEGECLHITTFTTRQPEALKALEKTIRQARQEIALDKVNLKLPFPTS